MLGINMSTQEYAHKLTHSEVGRTGQLQTHTFHNFTETWHLRERACPCPRWQEGPIQLIPTWGTARDIPLHRRKKWSSSPSLPSCRSQALLLTVTSWSLSREHPGYGLSKATGRRCLALLHHRCSWRPAAPAGRGLWPVSAPASRLSGRLNAVCNMSGRPEPGDRE